MERAHSSSDEAFEHFRLRRREGRDGSPVLKKFEWQPFRIKAVEFASDGRGAQILGRPWVEPMSRAGPQRLARVCVKRVFHDAGFGVRGAVSRGPGAHRKETDGEEENAKRHKATAGTQKDVHQRGNENEQQGKHKCDGRRANRGESKGFKRTGEKRNKNKKSRQAQDAKDQNCKQRRLCATERDRHGCKQSRKKRPDKDIARTGKPLGCSQIEQKDKNSTTEKQD